MATRLEHTKDLEEGGDSVLKEWLYKEIEEKEYLQRLLFLKAGLTHDDVVRQETTDYKPIHRSPSMRYRRAHKEQEQRLKARQAKGEAVEVAAPQTLSEAEKIFQQELEKA